VAKRAAGGPNKSEAIRAYKEANAEAGPKEIAAALAKDGLKVTPAFISTVLSNDRRKARKGRRKGGRKPGRQAGGGGGDALQALVQAKRLADQMGGVAKARLALDALARILGE
jgi:hypothetical protein